MLFSLSTTNLQAQETPEKKIPSSNEKLQTPSKETLKERELELQRMRETNKDRKQPTKQQVKPKINKVPDNCDDAAAGVKNEFAILYDYFQPRNRAQLTASQNLCTCVLKTNLDLKGCADLNGQKLVKMEDSKKPEGFNLILVSATPTMKKDDPRIKENSYRQKVVAMQYVEVNVTPLSGKTNCRLFSESDKYIVAIKPKPNSSSSVLPKKDVTVSNDGDQPTARWEFISINNEDPASGFYMVTNEENPRALYRNNQNELKLKEYSKMDGKALERAAWNYTIAGQDDSGHTRYVIRPLDDPRKAIEVDERTGSLKLGKNTVPTVFADVKGTKFSAQENKNIYWNVDRIF